MTMQSRRIVIAKCAIYENRYSKCILRVFIPENLKYVMAVLFSDTSQGKARGNCVGVAVCGSFQFGWSWAVETVKVG